MRRTWRLGAFLAAALGALSLACPSDPKLPGNAVLGSFDFSAEAADGGAPPDCPGPQPLFPASFTGTLSVETASGAAYLTVGSFAHVGTFVAGWFSVAARASRECPPGCRGTLFERLEGQLYEGGEVEPLADCPFPPERTDAGPEDWSLAGLSDAGRDVRRICAMASDTFVPLDGGPAGCDWSARFQVTGWRH